MAKSLKRVLSLLLLVLMSVCLLAGCVKPPKDEVQAKLLSSKFTYIQEDDQTEIFLAFDLLNGKKRAIERFEADITFTYKDGTTKDITVPFEEDIDYSTSSLLRVSFRIDGRAEKGVIQAFRFEMMNYWESFGSAIIGFCLGFLALGFVFMIFSMAEMTGWLSVGAGAVVLFDIAFLLFAPFIKSIIVILSSILAFVPMVVQNYLDY